MKNCLLILSIVTVTIACAQSKFTAIKSYGFLRQNSRGTMAVDEKNEPIRAAINSEYVVYIETSSTLKPTWTRAWIGHQTYNISGIMVKGTIKVGNNINGNMGVQLTSTNNTILWKLELQKTSPQTVPGSYHAATTGKSILVSGKINNKTFYYEVKNITQLQPVSYQ